MRNRSLGLTAMLFALGCGSADEHPLGGPYGGTSAAPTPDKGTGNAGPKGDGTGPAASDGTLPDGDAGSAPAPLTDGGETPQGPNDSGTKPPKDGAPPPPPTVTWSSIFNAYLAVGKIGDCGAAGCHSRMTTAPSAYSWLAGKGYISGTGSRLANPQGSCLSWYGHGGSMPPNGASSNAAATADITKWVAAGALNN